MATKTSNIEPSQGADDLSVETAAAAMNKAINLLDAKNPDGARKALLAFVVRFENGGNGNDKSPVSDTPEKAIGDPDKGPVTAARLRAAGVNESAIAYFNGRSDKREAEAAGREMLKTQRARLANGRA